MMGECGWCEYVSLTPWEVAHSLVAKRACTHHQQPSRGEWLNEGRVWFMWIRLTDPWEVAHSLVAKRASTHHQQSSREEWVAFTREPLLGPNIYRTPQLFTESRQIFTESRQLFTESRKLFTESRQLFTESSQMFTESSQMVHWITLRFWGRAASACVPAALPFSHFSSCTHGAPRGSIFFFFFFF
jgi:hypothetical protein